jgi:hypothetical protein
LKVLQPADERLQGMNFDHLATRAREQYATVEERRLAEAKMVLARLNHEKAIAINCQLSLFFTHHRSVFLMLRIAGGYVDKAS